jgi:hypothetical protein
MKTLMMLTSMTALIISCGGGGQSDNSKNKAKINIVSQSDPCSEKGACTVVRDLTFNSFFKLLKAGQNNSKAIVGTKVDSNNSKSEYTSSEDEGQIECIVSYKQSRTLLLTDKKYQYVKEETTKYSVIPKSKECQELIKADRNYSVIVKEHKKGLTEKAEKEYISTFAKAGLQTLRYKGDIVLRISGVAQFSYGDMLIEADILMMGKMLGNSFASDIINYTQSKTSLSFKRTTKISSNINVSSFKLSEIDPSEILDRTDSIL